MLVFEKGFLGNPHHFVVDIMSFEFDLESLHERQGFLFSPLKRMGLGRWNNVVIHKKIKEINICFFLTQSSPSAHMRAYTLTAILYR